MRKRSEIPVPFQKIIKSLVGVTGRTWILDIRVFNYFYANNRNLFTLSLHGGPLYKESTQNSRGIPVIDIESKCEEIDESWSPIEVARVNDQVVRMALCIGEYHWHRHTNEDELFYVYKGRLVIEMREHEDITLSAGELAVIPRNVEHRPVSDEPTYVMLFEPYALKSKGD